MSRSLRTPVYWRFFFFLDMLMLPLRTRRGCTMCAYERMVGLVCVGAAAFAAAAAAAAFSHRFFFSFLFRLLRGLALLCVFASTSHVFPLPPRLSLAFPFPIP